MNRSRPLTVHFFWHPGSGCERMLRVCGGKISRSCNRQQKLLQVFAAIGLLLFYSQVFSQDRGRITGTKCITSGGSPALTSLRSATGGVISWEKANNINFTGTAGVDVITIGGANSQSYTDGPITTSTFYRRILTPTGGGAPLYSDTIKITVSGTTPDPTFSPQVGTTTEICQQTTSFNVTYTTTNTPDKYSIIWSPAAISEGFQDVYNASLPAAVSPTTNNFSVAVPSAVSAGTFSGTLIAINTTTGCTVSNGSQITVNEIPVISVQPATTVQNICLSGTSTALSITATNPGGVLTTTSVQWYRNTANSNSGGTLVQINSAPPATVSYTPQTSVANALYYYAVVTNSKSCVRTSNVSGLVTVNAIPAAPAVTSNSPVCVGSSLNLTTATLSGAVYSWTGPNGFSSAVQNPSITTTSTAASGIFSLTVTVNDCVSAVSSTVVTVKATPASPSPANGGAVCVGTPLQLTTASLSGATYSWTGPNGFTSTVQNPSVTTTSTTASGTYSLTVTVNGCTSAVSTTTATVNAIPATPTVTINGPVCLGSTLNLATASVAGATYFWTGPNSFSTGAQNPSIASVSSAATGTYSLLVRVNNCNSPAGSALVTVNALPVATISATGATTFCNGGSVTLTASGGATYVWSTGATVNTIAVTNSGNITVTATDANGCKGISSPITVTVNPLPNLVITNPAAVCAPGTVNLSSAAVTTGSTTGTTFTYFTDAATSIPFTTPTTTGVAGTYYIKGTLPTGCSSSRAVTVVINNPPSLSTQNPSAVCAPQTVNLTSPAVTQGSDNGLLYTYYSNAALTTVLPNPGTVAASGVYYIKANAPGSACSVSLPVTVTVHPIPTGALQTPAVNYICSGSSLQLNATDAFAYQWLLNQTPITGATNAVYQASTAGVYSVRFISQEGCVREATNTLRIDELVKPVLRLQLKSRCVAAPISFSNLSTYANSGGINWQWNFGDGVLASSFSPTHMYTTGGNYTVSLTADNLSCPSFTETITAAIYIDSARVPVRYPTVKAVAGKAFPLTARSLGALYRWFPATGLNSTTVQSPMAILNNDIEYTVTITNSASCTTTDTVAVKLVFDGNIFVGNGFTPNGDGVNDRCYPILTGVRSLVYFKIYNRWGNLVFQTNDASPQNGWDGKLNGRLQAAGTYTWVSEAIDGKGNIFKQNGNVLLIN